jgi:hypothetical protein
MRDFLKIIKYPRTFFRCRKQNDAAARLNSKNKFTTSAFTDFFENNEKVQIESPEIYFYMRMNPGATVKQLSEYDNSAFLSEYEMGNSKILVLTRALF